MICQGRNMRLRIENPSVALCRIVFSNNYPGLSYLSVPRGCTPRPPSPELRPRESSICILVLSFPANILIFSGLKFIIIATQLPCRIGCNKLNAQSSLLQLSHYGPNECEELFVCEIMKAIA